jgi:hypothetical protein
MKMEKWLWITIPIVVFIVLVVGITFIFAIKFPYTTTEEYVTREPFTEQEAYETTEKYSDTEYYNEQECEDLDITKNIKWGDTQYSCMDTDCTSYKQVCIKKNWLGNCLEYQNVCQSTICSRYQISCNIVVKNLDNKGGTFMFDGYYITEDDKEHYVKELFKYLQPGDEYSFVWKYNVDSDDRKNCGYRNFKTPTKTECENIIKSQTVTKTRPVTKYRDVGKIRITTRKRSVTKYATLFNRMIGNVDYYISMDEMTE